MGVGIKYIRYSSYFGYWYNFPNLWEYYGNIYWDGSIYSKYFSYN